MAAHIHAHIQVRAPLSLRMPHKRGEWLTRVPRGPPERSRAPLGRSPRGAIRRPRVGCGIGVWIRSAGRPTLPRASCGVGSVREAPRAGPGRVLGEDVRGSTVAARRVEGPPHSLPALYTPTEPAAARGEPPAGGTPGSADPVLERHPSPGPRLRSSSVGRVSRLPARGRSRGSGPGARGGPASLDPSGGSREVWIRARSCGEDTPLVRARTPRGWVGVALG